MATQLVSKRKRHPLLEPAFILPFLAMICIFLAGLGVGYLLLDSLPEFSEQHAHLKSIPKTMQQLQELTAYLRTYLKQYYFQILFVLSYFYIFFQSFAVPGSLPFSLITGALFGLPVGIVVVALCSAVGATNAYFLSKWVGKPILDNYLAQRLEKLQKDVNQTSSFSLFGYIVFLRITPLVPNWLINISAPHLKVPIPVYFLGTFFGVMPLSVVHIQAGETLEELSTFQDLNVLKNPWMIAKLCAIGLVSLVPILLSRKRQTQSLDKTKKES